VVLRLTGLLRSSFAYGTFTPLVSLSSAVRLEYLALAARAYNPTHRSAWFGLFRVRSPLLAESFLFLRVLRCFSSPGSLGQDYVFILP
jgi:hypothetical protein